MGVNADFFGDFMRDNEQDLVPMLEDDIRVLIYAGGPVKCNHNVRQKAATVATTVHVASQLT